MQYTLTVRGGLLEIQIAGGITKSEILELWFALEKLPKTPKIDRAIVKFTEVWWETAGHDIRDLADRVCGLPGVHWAFTATENLSYGIATLFVAQRHRQGDRFRVFKYEEMAREWLYQATLKGDVG